MARVIKRHNKILLVILLCAIAIPLVALAVLWFTLPSVDSLHSHAQAPSTKIYDRNGQLLYEIIDPRVGYHTPLAFEQFPLRLRQATIAVEDANFYSNPGVDIVGIVRALWINVQGGEVLAGGSTITQQLARMLLLSPEERTQRTLLRKVRESLLAWQIAMRYSKDEVLTLYLNEVYYGNLAYGAEAAAQTYFDKPVDQLDLAECALLAGLPQSPVAYDPYNDASAARQRQTVVLDLMVKEGFISADEAGVAKQARLSYAPAQYAIRAPHFVSYVRHWLEERYGAEMLTRGGLVVSTTLDLALNDTAQDVIQARLKQLQEPSADSPSHNTNNAALVALDPHSGAIVAMVGSPDYFDAQISGAVNAAVALRQPGSAIKPITYAAALSQVPNFTAATPIMDVRTSFPTREGLPYVPENYDRQHYGPISVREALATSNNVAAVKVLQMVGLERMLDLANDLGIHSFKSVESYGLSLTLGGGEVRLLELTAAYAAFDNGGVRVDPYAVSRVTDQSGQVLYAHSAPEDQKPVVDPRVAWLITSILSDNAARASEFGENSVLRISHPAAVKTGTTTDWRDNWTVGYTPDLVTGVWTGNADSEPMIRVSGVSGAGPIWHDFMELALRGQPSRNFSMPEGIVQVTVCALSGMLPSPDCPHTRSEWFIKGTQPTQVDNWYVHQKIDVTTGKLANANTPAGQVVDRVMIQLPAEARAWATEQGWPVALLDDQSGGACEGEACAAIVISQPDPGSIYRISEQLPRAVQKVPLEVNVNDAHVERAELILDGEEVIAQFSGTSYKGFWTLEPGDHQFVARAYLRDGTQQDSAAVTIHVAE
jgi:1A family penicillin-binding protein